MGFVADTGRHSPSMPRVQSPSSTPLTSYINQWLMVISGKNIGLWAVFGQFCYESHLDLVARFASKVTTKASKF